ncbi:T. brucei spp.-specific protein [Trypanosoma brucei gambiense DAL972]|uniref:T. brucei spp.-specific protein n=1 Tax=Trypanosoma brucei gambiense (strain MHOM/CI/86/DAL972) TaxID=679716 RepID=C9ZV61_TRYB9|nr:T. brucei spp.-specific protein [Trypanosoma brucei gambiense DAL972]CBH13299.1 T. brucei spp.-specific protein [Trypanosoma brucei gambiense DAL972]|eukprot:XP_011775576.1 T. brucei spp.-specific protein [Trypanosoma brucei gambiense DAL972]
MLAVGFPPSLTPKRNLSIRRRCECRIREAYFTSLRPVRHRASKEASQAVPVAASQGGTKKRILLEPAPAVHRTALRAEPATFIIRIWLLVISHLRGCTHKTILFRVRS